MKDLDKKTLEKFIKLIGDKLEGNWVIIGGAMLLYLGVSDRVTYDIDIIAPPESDRGQTLKLFEITEKLGLEVGTINQAAAFFLNKIKDWEKSIVLIHGGKNANVYRPNSTLYILTKLSRLSESDYGDCIAMLTYAKKNREPVEKTKIEKIINKEIQGSSLPEKEKRLKNLMDEIRKL
ncbi:MAG: hypothetical protein A3F16_01690 [Deltaproteobacteria bacterium RIFCSPHIGHO2_12_FULL_43_9]|nr:MAG: hypothetical protein A3F16_01690 [Deltaproteobacteria bacterium RIFCSPHIGHO2_12_FULL_43_9]